MEDGEIPEDVSGGVYHPSFEFPCDDGWSPATSSCPDATSSLNHMDNDQVPRAHASTTSSSSNATSNTIPAFRLVVRSSGILFREHSLAVLDGHTQIQIGRDAPPPGSTTPRVRLKEMEVSKLHVTLFWDAARREWAVVDMGSKHGTFVRPPSGNTSTAQTTAESAQISGGGTVKEGADPRGQRLSPPRVSSVPRRLRHLDELSVGSTTFVVHIHEDRVPCVACSPKGRDEIPLFHDKKGKGKDEATGKRKRDAESASNSTPEERNPKKALTMLKRSLLSRHSTPPAQSDIRTATYVDRSAKRRALHVSAPDAPGVLPRSLTSTPSTGIPAPAITPSPPVSAPSTPLPSSNIGHKLLTKQGWQPGTSLGVSDEPVEGSMALIEPLEVVPRAARTGLGAPNQPSHAISSLSWKDEGRFRRWSHFRNVDGGSE